MAPRGLDEAGAILPPALGKLLSSSLLPQEVSNNSQILGHKTFTLLTSSCLSVYLTDKMSDI
jgi:hypothetical protein